MKPPHAAIVHQNALLEEDLRPRREAETLAAAGYAGKLVDRLLGSWHAG